MRVAIAGASGFVGRALIDKILKETNWTIVALSRSEVKNSSPRVTWCRVDLFSFEQLSNSLKSVNTAFYLVHSMLPSAQLDQGSFEDYDLLLADNFAKACSQNKVSHVVYLGGILPANAGVSKHLRSRAEVEKVLSAGDFVTTHLRAGLVIGKNGSSFNIMYNLISRLPVLACPSWTRNPMTPIDLFDVVSILVDSARNIPATTRIFDIGGPETFTYFELLRICAEEMHKKRLFIKLPFSINFISRYWVRLFSGASKELVYPLLDSLSIPMNIDETKRYPNYKNPIDYRTSLRNLIQTKLTEIRYTPAKYQQKFVRSVQRIQNPHDFSAIQAANFYFDWVPTLLGPVVRVKRDQNKISFFLFSKALKILELVEQKNTSNQETIEFKIVSGILVSKNEKARFEFRKVLGSSFLIVAIHDFRPALPWFIYRSTQALLHAWVMSRFSRFLCTKLA